MFKEDNYDKIFRFKQTKGCVMKIHVIQKIIDIIRMKRDTVVELNNFYNKFIQLEYYKNEMETLVLGSSHANYNFLATEKEFNLGLNSQDLYNSYKLYESYSKSTKLKNIIIFYSVFSEGFILDKTNSKDLALFYKLIYKIRILHNCLSLKLKEFVFPWYFMKVIGNKIEFNNGNPSRIDKNLEVAKLSITSRKRALAHLKTHNRPDKQVKYLHKIAELCSKNSHNLYIVVAPATKEYKENLPASNFLFAPLTEFKNVEIINLCDSNLFNKDDFADWDHLNYYGALKCTNFIKEKMAKTQALQRE